MEWVWWELAWDEVRGVLCYGVGGCDGEGIEGVGDVVFGGGWWGGWLGRGSGLATTHRPCHIRFTIKHCGVVQKQVTRRNDSIIK